MGDNETASQYQWACPVLDDWICETHCAEFVMACDDIRSLGSEAGFENLLANDKMRTDTVETCEQCPHRGS